MRVTGNSQWEFKVWQAGLYLSAPAVIDHAMIGMALHTSGDVPRLAMLMHDRSADLVPPGDDLIPISQHGVFIRHLAIMHAANGEGDYAGDVAASTIVQDLLPRVVNEQRAYRVVDGGAQIGVVDRTAVLEAMIEEH